jgi:signal transduction histidine kinase
MAATVEPEKQVYEWSETRDLVALVNDAAKQVETKGEAAFPDFRVADSRWRKGETYIFVLNREGDMLVHPDRKLEGKNQLALQDVNGKLIIRGLIHAATAVPEKPAGWYHYEWPVPGEILPRWKSTYVRLVKAPSGKSYIVASGMYEDRMERAFVVDMVDDAVHEVEERGEAAFSEFRERTGPYIAKNAYIFVLDPKGVELVNPAFPGLENKNLLNARDAQGKEPIREMVEIGRLRHSGAWVDYMWPKPGESVSMQKSAYVRRANLGEDKWVVVGCGIYPAGAARVAEPEKAKMTAAELVRFVREAAAVLQTRGETAYPDFAEKGSKWFRDDTYVFVWSMDGITAFYPVDRRREGTDESALKDALGKPVGRMFLEAAASPTGEGFVHYMYPEPGKLFPAWKSTFVKQVTFPSGKRYFVGSGVYDMKMDRAFIVDAVNRAAALIEERGKSAFPLLRDKAGPFFFMDTYVFVDTPAGIEVVNAAQPSLEGKNVAELKDAKGRLAAREYIDAAMKGGSAWVVYDWYRPGQNTVAPKHTFVRKAQYGADTYIVGSGLYAD